MPTLSLVTPIGFVFAIVLRATAVTYLTDLVCALARLRSRCLERWLTVLLAQADACRLRHHAPAIARAILRHPLIGSPAWPGDLVRCDQLPLILKEFVEGDFCFSPCLEHALRPHLVADLELWFDQAMLRASRSYRWQARAVTGLASFLILWLTEPKPFASFQTLLFLWLPLTFGSPYWYDLLQRLAPVLRAAGGGRGYRRPTLP